MKNYELGAPMTSLRDEVLPYLYTNKSVYFLPSGKVLPSKFFTGWLWVSSGALEKHILNGSFLPAENYNDLFTKKIKQTLEQCPVIINKKVA